MLEEEEEEGWVPCGGVKEGGRFRVGDITEGDGDRARLAGWRCGWGDPLGDCLKPSIEIHTTSLPPLASPSWCYSRCYWCC